MLNLIPLSGNLEIERGATMYTKKKIIKEIEEVLEKLDTTYLLAILDTIKKLKN